VPFDRSAHYREYNLEGVHHIPQTLSHREWNVEPRKFSEKLLLVALPYALTSLS